MEESEPLNPNATHRFTKLSQDSRSCYHCGRDIFNVLHITAMEPGDVLETPDGVSKVTMDYWDEKQPVTRVIQIKDRKSTRLNSSHMVQSRMPSSA